MDQVFEIENGHVTVHDKTAIASTVGEEDADFHNSHVNEDNTEEPANDEEEAT